MHDAQAQVRQFHAGCDAMIQDTPTQVGYEARASLAVEPPQKFAPLLNVSSFVESQFAEFQSDPGSNPYQLSASSDCQVLEIVQ
jgi:hypothetical protein